ncbi:hypothetical protein ACWPKO_23675 (plasmid) [Coraliomargarita sp. W4R53]
MITMLGLLVHRISQRSSLSTLAWFAFLAVAVGSWQIGQLSRAGHFLLTGLGLNG